MAAPRTPAKDAEKPTCISYRLCGSTWMPVQANRTATRLRPLQPCNDLSPPPEPRLRFLFRLVTDFIAIGRWLGL